ncbi:hypothetical protein KO465_02015 [Candidatus Micrarchaeota archaeon]|nr:hypothetical protein [Candidatus Micrarchaeota archaeon]
MKQVKKSVQRAKYNLGKGPLFIGAFVVLAVAFLAVLLIVGVLFSEEMDIRFGTTNPLINNTVDEDIADDDIEVDDFVNETIDEEEPIDIHVCDIYTDSEYDICMMKETKDVSYCKDDFECVLEYAKTFRDNTVCDMFSLEYQSLSCKAIANNNGLVCEDTNFDRVSDRCYYHFVLYTNNYAYCDMIKEIKSLRIDCYSYSAINAKDVKYCERTLKSGDKDECYLSFVDATGDISICDKLFIKDINSFTCYYNPAVKFGRMSYCDNVITSKRLNCYNYVLHTSEKIDVEDCDNILDYSWRDQCYIKASQQENDNTYCAKISSDSSKRSCYSFFE